MTPLQSATLLCGLLVAQAASAQAPAVVGEATLVIGQAQVVHASGQTSPVIRGSAIQVGDIIQTDTGGHLRRQQG